MPRKPIGDEPLTPTEYQRRWRAKKGETLQAKYDLLRRQYDHLRREFDSDRAAHDRHIDNMVSAKYRLIAERDAALRKVEQLERELSELKRLSVVVPFKRA